MITDEEKQFYIDFKIPQVNYDTCEDLEEVDGGWVLCTNDESNSFCTYSDNVGKCPHLNCSASDFQHPIIESYEEKKLEQIVLKKYILLKEFESTDKGYDFVISLMDYESSEYNVIRTARASTSVGCIALLCCKLKSEIYDEVRALFGLK